MMYLSLSSIHLRHQGLKASFLLKFHWMCVCESSVHFVRPTRPALFEPDDQEISKFCFVQERRVTDFEVRN